MSLPVTSVIIVWGSNQPNPWTRSFLHVLDIYNYLYIFMSLRNILKAPQVVEYVNFLEAIISIIKFLLLQDLIWVKVLENKCSRVHTRSDNMIQTTRKGTMVGWSWKEMMIMIMTPHRRLHQMDPHLHQTWWMMHLHQHRLRVRLPCFRVDLCSTCRISWPSYPSSKKHKKNLILICLINFAYLDRNSRWCMIN